MSEQFYNFTANSINGEEISMAKYEGFVILVVNTASNCLFTKQYAELEELYQEYKGQDFVVLGFPCNQFAGQEPGNNQEIANFCQLNYGVSFPLFSKIEVIGSDAHPIFCYLTQELGGIFTSDIKWNFTKFLIDRNGTPRKRFAPSTSPSSLYREVEKLL